MGESVVWEYTAIQKGLVRQEKNRQGAVVAGARTHGRVCGRVGDVGEARQLQAKAPRERVPVEATRAVRAGAAADAAAGTATVAAAGGSSPPSSSPAAAADVVVQGGGREVRR